MKKIYFIMIIILLLGTAYAGYIGGRMILVEDQFYFETEYRGYFDCFQFSWINQSQKCLVCKNGVVGISMDCVEDVNYGKNNSDMLSE